MVVLNGHNASENTDPWPSLGRFLLQWARGTQVDSVLARMMARHRYGGRDTVRRRLAGWRHSREAARRGATQAENLAVGFFGAASPRDAAAGGPAFVVRSTGPTNATIETSSTPAIAVLEEAQNVPMQFIVILRESGVLYCLGSLPGTAHPSSAFVVRPVGIDATPVPSTLWAGVHQAVLGQVGWGVDTRVEDVRVARPSGLSRWYTTADVAVRHAGGVTTHCEAERGGPWMTWPLGADHRIAVLEAPTESGLTHASVFLAQAEQQVALLVRGHRSNDGATSGWLIVASATGVAAQSWSAGARTTSHLSVVSLPIAQEATLQIVDDGRRLSVVIDGRLALGPFDAGASGRAVGIRTVNNALDGAVRALEAHPSTLQLPQELLADLPPVPCGQSLVYRDDFTLGDSLARDGKPEAGTALAGRAVGNDRWEHTIGSTPFLLDGGGALVQPVVAPRGGLTGKGQALFRPEEHRNAFTLRWPDPALADATVRLIAPGTGAGQGQRGRGGLIFRQDRDHHLIVNTWIDDEYGGTSVSSFLRIGGFEDVYDAVWTNVGRRITWGKPYDLRVGFDGTCYVVSVDGEPVLYRRITDIVPSAKPLRIERIGIVSNWEFGDDTGSRFVEFRAFRGAECTAASSEQQEERP